MPNFDILGAQVASPGWGQQGSVFNNAPLVGQQPGAMPGVQPNSAQGQAQAVPPGGLLAGILGLPAYGNSASVGQMQPNSGQLQPNIGTGVRSLLDGMMGAGR